MTTPQHGSCPGQIIPVKGHISYFDTPAGSARPACAFDVGERQESSLNAISSPGLSVVRIAANIREPEAARSCGTSAVRADDGGHFVDHLLRIELSLLHDFVEVSGNGLLAAEVFL